MNNRFLRPAALLCGALLATLGAAAQNPLNPPAITSPYGGNVVEDIVARVNDQIISQSDYDRAVQQLDEEGQQRGESMQEMSEARKDLLRNLIDQQLWLSKAKELGITGDTDLVKRLDDIRKQYNMASLEDLENAAKQQGVSWEDFQQNIRNQIVTQNVMRQEVGEKIQFTPGEAMQYYDQHKQEFEQPESVRLSEILIPASSDDAAKLAAAKTKADDIEAKLKAGADFAELARTESQGQTAAQGGDLGQYRRGALAKVLEDKTFVLQAGQSTAPIQTRQGWVILKVTQHTPAGAQPYKDVQEQVEEALYMSRMEPAIRSYLTKMREEAFIDIKPGYADTGASPNETKPVFSAYVPPAPKKKAKIERTRYREETHGFRQKSAVVSDEPATSQPAAAQATATKDKKNKKEVVEKPGKKEKIRYGQAPRETLPTASTNSNTENAGALPESAAANEPANPLEPTAPTQKSRFSSRARTEKKQKGGSAQNNGQTPPAPDAAEVADRQTQSAPLGLGGSTAAKKKHKKAQATTGEKTRMSQEPKKPEQPKAAPEMTPAPQEPGAPAPAQQPTAQPAPQPQQ